VTRRATVVITSLLLGASAAYAAPKIERVAVRPNPAQFSGGKAPEVEIAVTITRTRFDTGSCDARVDFGDGQGRSVDFGVAATRTLRHVYQKNGSYTVVARGAGGTPCEGSQQAALSVTGAPEAKKAEAKKAEPKKAEPKKKPEAKKKAEPKKKPAQKDTKKKDDPK
jgi:hypothetical protein